MEIAVMSGKGGTGKTTLAIALASLHEEAIKIDCDVDAANLYMFFEYNIDKKEDVMDAFIASIDNDKCIECGRCEKVCVFNAIKDYQIEPLYCEGCKACYYVCPADAINVEKEKIATKYVSSMNQSKLVYANMEIGADGSGKLVMNLKEEAKKDRRDLYVTDGSPGIGCQVMATVTDCDLILLVTEPSKSGLSDALRLLDLADYFKKPVLAVVNKCDINDAMTEEIEKLFNERDVQVIGRIPYDSEIFKANQALEPILMYNRDADASQEILKIHQRLEEFRKEYKK